MPRPVLVLVACFATIVFLGCPPALAGSAPKKDSHGAPAKKEEDKGLFGSADNEVILPTLIAPVTVDGRIRDYLYLYLVAVAENAAEAGKVKAKMPFVQDALVREVHRAVLVRGEGHEEPDTDSLMERIALRLNQVVDTKSPVKIAVNRIDTAPF